MDNHTTIISNLTAHCDILFNEYKKDLIKDTWLGNIMRPVNHEDFAIAAKICGDFADAIMAAGNEVLKNHPELGHTIKQHNKLYMFNFRKLTQPMFDNSPE